jgi:RNA polymerase sigma factor (sigma-70 family)
MLPKEKISHIYKMHSAELFRYLCKLTGDSDASEDLLQETFEKFIAYSAEKAVQEEKYRSFLYTTAHNLCINYLVKRNRTHPGDIDDMEESLKTEDKHHERLVMDDINRKIYQILEKIDPESRSIFIMHKENGMSYDEIAANISLSARTVRRRVKEVLDILYVELKKEGFFI